MTNAEYVKQNMTDLDLAYLVCPYAMSREYKPSLFVDKVRLAWDKWAESASTNRGNMAVGIHGNTEIKENPSIWAWEEWCYPDGKWRKSGRNQIISFLVWLSEQYDSEDWVEDE